MTEPTLQGYLGTVWQHLLHGVNDRHHPCRHPTLATIGPDGPQARTLVLRAANQGVATLTLHTDSASAKTSELCADPRVAIHVWLPDHRLQFRLSGIATLQSGDMALWSSLPARAQANYGSAPSPGAPIAAPGAVASTPDPARFTQITCQIASIDLLHLAADRHYRAAFDAKTNWQGRWLAP